MAQTSGDSGLQMRGVSKRFGPIRALEDAHFEVRPGEVMALLGENGAGKSTLVKILSGIYQCDEGEITLDGEPLDPSTPRKAEQAGIAVVQQHFSLVNPMTVAENIFLGHPRSGHFWSPRRLGRRAAPFLELVGLADLDPACAVGTLSVAERQLIELARLLAREARILILDEPTAALSDAECERVKAVVRSLSDRDHSIVYVTHRLDEVFELADRVTVFRNGRSQEPVEVSDLDVDSLVERIIGRPLEEMYPPRGSSFGEEVFAVEGLDTLGLRAPVGFTVRAGEIVGLAGQLGSGITPVMEALGGARPITAGTLRLGGEEVAVHSPRSALKAGIAYCSSDRQRDGVFLTRPAIENVSAPALEAVSPGGWVSRRREVELGEHVYDTFGVQPRRLTLKVGKLSGGNQQKVALGKWLSARPRVLLAEAPTVGVDVGARAEIYTQLRKLADDGLAIVLASWDMQEVLGMADRVLTFYKGAVVSSLQAHEADPAAVLRDITHPEEART